MQNKKIYLFTILFTILFISITNKNGLADEFKKVENSAFKEGEKLTFDVKYGFVTAGVAIMSITKIRRISGRNAYHVNFEVNSIPSFDWVFKVRDKYESYVDVEGLFPWRFEQHIREGNYSRDFSAFFDQRRGRAKTSEGEYPIPKNVHDIISAFYFARTVNYSNMEVGDKIELKNFYKDKVFDLDVKFLGRERITVAAGTFDCVIVEPLVQEGGLFKSEGNIVIWLSDDTLKVPIKVKTKVVIGSIDAELTSFEGLAGKFTAKVK
ncbi:MAG: DUF3108 domain-containing protein [Ignavibacteriaceae bacterium]|nr:DUF3108 domain-containing protein [Ignavibacteriaceae bacterium]